MKIKLTFYNSFRFTETCRDSQCSQKSPHLVSGYLYLTLMFYIYHNQKPSIDTLLLTKIDTLFKNS